MNLRQHLVGVMACAVITSFGYAGIDVTTGLPISAFISVDNDGISNGRTRLSPTGGAAWHIKGNSFVLDAPYDITSLTVRIDDQADSIVDGDGSLTLDFYNIDGDPNDTQGDGPVPTDAPFFRKPM